MKIISVSYYIVCYSIALALSISIFMIFRPFSYVNNDQSLIKCHKDGIAYEIGPNLIFAIDKNLDSFNDSKARKLCEYTIINDYNNIYKTPDSQNYTFLSSLREKNSWPTAIFVFFITFTFCSFILESLGKIFDLGTSFLAKKVKELLYYIAL